MKITEFIQKWNVAYEDKEQQLEFSEEMENDLKEVVKFFNKDNLLSVNSLVNPYKELRCNYVYDYCEPESCNCKKSSEWEKKHNKYHDWVNYVTIKPPLGVEVLAQTDEWISEDYNKNGIRVGFQNEDDNGPFVSAKWNNCFDTYENCEEHKPVRWKFY